MKIEYIYKILASYLVQFASIGLVFALDKEDYARFSIFFATCSFVFLISSGVTYGAMVSLGGRSKAGAFSNAVITRYAYVLLILLISYVVLPLIYGEGLSWPFALGYYYVFIFALISYEAATQLLYSTDFIRRQSKQELLMSLLLLVAVVFFVRKSEWYFYVYALLAIFFSLRTIFFILNKSLLSIRVLDWGEFSFFIKYSSWQFISVFSIYMMNYGLNFYLVNNNFSENDIGTMNITLRLFFGFSALFSLVVILMPKLVNQCDLERDRGRVIAALFLVTFILSLIYFLVFIVVKEVVVFFDLNKYQASVDLIVLMFPGFIGMAFLNMANSFLANTSKYKVSQILVLSVFVLSAMWLYVVGAKDVASVAISYNFSYVVSSLMALIYLVVKFKTMQKL